VIQDCEQVRGAALPAITAPPLHLLRRASDTGAAAGGAREQLGTGGNSGDSDLRLPGGRLVASVMRGSGGERGRAVTFGAFFPCP